VSITGRARQIAGSSSAPYINNTLLPMASHAELYFNPPLVHPSLPNYLWLEAGINFGVFNDDPPSANHQSTTQHLVTLLQKSGISWKTYQENIGGADCPLVSNGLYAVKHNPFVYFDDVTDNGNPNSANCISHVRPFGELATDLANNTVAQYNFITPNLCNDMHDSCAPLNDPIRQGDTWLSQNLPAILDSAAYRSGGAVYAAESRKPPSAKATTGQPRATNNATRMPRSTTLTNSAARSRPRRVIMPDSTGWGA